MTTPGLIFVRCLTGAKPPLTRLPSPRKALGKFDRESVGKKRSPGFWSHNIRCLTGAKHPLTRLPSPRKALGKFDQESVGKKRSPGFWSHYIRCERGPEKKRTRRERFPTGLCAMAAQNGKHSNMTRSDFYVLL